MIVTIVEWSCALQETQKAGVRPTDMLLCSSLPAKASSKVDLPEPGGPSSRQILLGGMMPLTLSRMVKVRLAVFFTLSISRKPCKQANRAFSIAVNIFQASHKGCHPLTPSCGVLQIVMMQWLDDAAGINGVLGCLVYSPKTLQHVCFGDSPASVTRR